MTRAWPPVQVGGEWRIRERRMATRGVARAKAETAMGGSLRTAVLGSGGGIPSSERATACLLVREADRALLLDAGSGLGRLRDDPVLLQGIDRVDVVLTHFHFDHICGLPVLQWLPVEAAIWAPGRWLYDRPSADILAPLRRPPISPGDVTSTPVCELREGVQEIGGFSVRASAQPRYRGAERRPAGR